MDIVSIHKTSKRTIFVQREQIQITASFIVLFSVNKDDISSILYQSEMPWFQSIAI